jgi:renalase
VLVVGAGMAGAACAATLRAAGVDVEVRERAHDVGGRLAAPVLDGRAVDLGGAYFTVEDDSFADQVEQWRAGGLAREWTDTLDAISDAGRVRKAGPVRWSAPHGLASLPAELFTRAGIDVDCTHPVRSLDDAPDYDAVVLAMPDPQAARLAGDVLPWVAYDPVVSVAVAYPRREWQVDAAAFVNDDPDITLVADDGARRGDGAAVLVVHTTSQLARDHAADAAAAIPPVLAALRRALGVVVEPVWTHAVSWPEAKPVDTHGDAPFALLDAHRPLLGVCGDSWCPEGSPRVEAAWLSGRRLGGELARRLGTGG